MGQPAKTAPRNRREASARGAPANVRNAPASKANRKRPRANSRRVTKPSVPLRARLRVWRERVRLRLAAWQRSLWVGGQVMLFLAMLAGVVGAYRLIARYVETAPAFAAREIAIEGHSQLNRGQVLDAAGLAIGKNVFAVDPVEARTALERHPWITSARVERRLPDTYRISITERVAVATLVLDTLYLVADDGKVFKAVDRADPIDLPLITGMNAARFEVDSAYRASTLLGAVALLQDYRAAGLWRKAPVAEIHIQPDLGLSLYVGDDPTLVRLGKAPFRDKLTRLRKVLERLARRNARAAYVYLDNVRRPDRVTVKIH